MKNKPKCFEKISPDFSAYERTPPWSLIGSRQLAAVFSVHLQSVSNYVCRGFLEPNYQKSNRNYYRLSYLKSLFENRTEEEIQWKWLEEYIYPHFQPPAYNLNGNPPYDNLEEAYEDIRICYEVYELSLIHI